MLLTISNDAVHQVYKLASWSPRHPERRRTSMLPSSKIFRLPGSMYPLVILALGDSFGALSARTACIRDTAWATDRLRLACSHRRTLSRVCAYNPDNDESLTQYQIRAKFGDKQSMLLPRPCPRRPQQPPARRASVTCGDSKRRVVATFRGYTIYEAEAGLGTCLGCYSDQTLQLDFG